MANNILVSYDLDAPGQNYEKVTSAIESIGGAVKIHLSLYYLKTDLDAEAVCNYLLTKIDKNDRLFVVNATNNSSHGVRLLGHAEAYLEAHWSK